MDANDLFMGALIMIVVVLACGIGVPSVTRRHLPETKVGRMYFFGYKCDECGTLKQETNHWYVMPLRSSPADPFFLYRWEQMLENERQKAHTYCGQACVIKALNRFMQQGEK